MTETEYLNSTEANSKRLQESIAQLPHLRENIENYIRDWENWESDDN